MSVGKNGKRILFRNPDVIMVRAIISPNQCQAKILRICSQSRHIRTEILPEVSIPLTALPNGHKAQEGAVHFFHTAGKAP